MFLWFELKKVTKTSDVRQEKTDLKVFVVVFPYPGLGSHQSLFGYDTNYKILLYCLHRLYSVVGANPSLGMCCGLEMKTT